MNKLLTGILVLLAQFSFGQNYDDLMNKAGEALQKKEFCSALTLFETAFEDTTKIGTYDLAYGAIAALKCNKEKQALLWLSRSQQKGLGANESEIAAIENDSIFIGLHNYSEWTQLIMTMKKALVEKLAFQERQKQIWLQTISQNIITPKSKRQFVKAKNGFALYFTQIDTLKIPYLVYVPKTYNSSKPNKVIIYLHGGIVSTDNFNYSNYEIGTGEPIFSIGDSFNSIIVYPFGKKDFGWVNQVKAFENIFTIIDSVKTHYNIDNKEIYLGGMSNGGTAIFWFASKKPNIFKGFYAFSANPKLEIGKINFSNLSQGKPIYTVNAKDDEVFKLDDVLNIYNKQEALAKDWKFDTVYKGNHGFIYDPQNGKKIMNDLFKKLISK
jgi:predicted peptidase